MKSNKRAFVFILLNTSIHLWRNSSHWKGERKQKPKAPENIFSAISGTEVPPPPGCIFNTKAQTPSVCSQISPGPASGSQDSDPVPSAGLVWPVRCPLGETVPGLPFPGPSAEQGAGEAGGTAGGVPASAGSVPHQVPGEKRQGLYTDGRCGACDPASPRTARARKHLYVKAAVTDE